MANSPSNPDAVPRSSCWISRNKPTAIIASNDDMAAGTLWMAQQRGLKLPDDLSVVGFDDTPTALKTWPPLTVIRQPITAMVERGVALLMEEARETKPSAPSDVVLDYTLVERASTAPCKPPHDPEKDNEHQASSHRDAGGGNGANDDRGASS